jgi:hypothetical protein
MTLMKLSIAAVLALALAGVAIGAPTPRDNLGRGDTSKNRPQLDRAVLYRPAQVGECAAIPQQRTAATRPARKQDARFNARRDRKTLANVGCNAVWSN